MSDSDGPGPAPGPIDFIVIEFPAGTKGLDTAMALVDLVERGVVRLFDLMVVRKDDDGRCVEVDLAANGAEVAELLPFAGARSGLLGPDDVEAAAEVLEPGTIGVIIVYENAWASPFVAAAHSEGGVLVASARLTAQEILDALDAVEAQS